MSNRICPHVFFHDGLVARCVKMRDHAGQQRSGVVYHESREVAGYRVTWVDGSTYDFPNLVSLPW